MRRGSSKEEQDRKRLNRESGALFSDCINVMAAGQSSGMSYLHHVISHQYHVISTVDQVDSVTQFSQSEELIGQVKPHQKKCKPTVRGFDLFESSGLIMGV